MTLREQLLRDEGVRLRPYKDSVGKLTIGIGRNLDDVGISMSEAELMLSHDISRAWAALIVALSWSVRLDEARRGVLLNMAFNLGINGLLGFERMLTACEAGDYDRAAREMLESKWATQVGPRAHRLAQQMRSGEWQ